MYVTTRNTDYGDQVVVNGWFAPPPSRKDYNDRTYKVLSIIENKTGLLETATAEDLPVIVDLRSKFPAIRNQKNLGSCIPFGVVSLFEYHALNMFQSYTRLSERALYKSMRFLLGFTGDSGGYVRAGMGAAKALGIPPDKYWKYDVANFDQEIPAMVQNLGENYSGMTYFRHDGGENTPPACALLSMKKYLAAGIPSVFGFYGFESFNDSGRVPFPGPSESAQWGHAVAAAGYDDVIKIPTGDGNNVSTGAILFRNSWSSSWGKSGYGYLPYDYFMNRYALDIWSVIDANWIDTGLYGF